ncbi:MAG: hypothetical protein KY410_03120, partial [Proteobacteria bacterium]|nr:hypothetical protein [Pseudomonadota bacterium]
MKTRKRFSLSNFLVLAIFAVTPVLTVADDTDIYLAAESSGDSRSQYESNILFIIDTSGSMDNARIGAYDPSIDYIQELDDLGITHNCARGKLYRVSTNKTGDAVPQINCSIYYLYEAQFRCQEAYDTSQPFNLTENGFWFGVVRQYDPVAADWQSLSSDDQESSFPYACWSESGRLNPDTGQVEYMVEGPVSGFSTDPAQEISAPTSDYTLFSANYLAWYHDYIRIEVLNRVFKNTINDLNTGNVGVMRFSQGSGQGGMVIQAMDHISGIKPALNTLADTHFTIPSVDGATPLAETMWEAYNYYSGSRVDTGGETTPTSVAASRLASDSSFYQTPIQKACQKNFIVYLSDGEADADDLRDNQIRTLIGPESSCSHDGGDNCLDDLAVWMSQNDITPDIGAADDPDEVQTVTTHTIGFGIDTQLLRDTATRSGGRYFSAASAPGLKSAFEDILREVTADSGSFTPPAVSVNAFNHLTHRDDLFFTLFKPSVNSHWDGNLKKYRLKKKNGVLQIVDAENAPAVNPIEGTYKRDTRSFWTPIDETDGDDIAKGGAAANVQLTLQNGKSRPRTALPASSEISNAINVVDDTNTTNITKTLLDIDSEDDTYHAELL